MKVLFIGGTGNISSAVSRLCVAKGMELHHLNRGKTNCAIDGAVPHIGDINDKYLPAPIPDINWDCVVDWVAFTAADAERDISLFRGKTKQYVFISSASVYQKPPANPVITESTPLSNPFWEYSRNKIRCENILNEAYRNFEFPVTIVRPSLTYDTVIPVAIGGFDEYTIAGRILKDEKIIVHGNGTSLWTVTHSEDFARGFIGIIGNVHALGHSFHITSDEILTWNQIYNILAGALGREPKIVHIPSDFICRADSSLTGTLLGDKSESAIFDNSKIKSFVPGFNAVIPFSEGIKKTLAWFDADPGRKVVKKETDESIDRIIKLYESVYPETV